MTQFAPNPVSSLLTTVPSASSRVAQEQLCRERNLSLLWLANSEVISPLTFVKERETHDCMYR